MSGVILVRQDPSANLSVRSCPVMKLICQVRSSPRWGRHIMHVYNIAPTKMFDLPAPPAHTTF